VGALSRGPALLEALADGRAPRAVWSALPGPAWPSEVALAVQACTSSGRGAVVVVPDARDLERVTSALAACGVPAAALTADLGPAERYRRWLSVLRGTVPVAVGTRAAAFAPVRDLGLVVVWDDGDDLHAEPRRPIRTSGRSWPCAPTTPGRRCSSPVTPARRRRSCWSTPAGRARSRPSGRSCGRTRRASTAPVTTSSPATRRPPAARLPAVAFDAARRALADGAPVLVQVPRRGYVPSLACARDRTPARCAQCAGPLAAPSGEGVVACRWCGRPAADWACPDCGGTRLRSSVVGAGRTAEELGRAFPGTPVRTSGRDGSSPACPPARPSW
jgi:primosomal protein N' (replication factor Y)